MADEMQWNAIIEAKMEGFDTAEKALTSVNNLVEALGRKGVISAKDVDTLSKSMERVRGKLDSSTKSVADQVSGWSELKRSIAETSKELSNVAKANVVSGGLNPMTGAASSLSIQEARKIMAVQEASNVSAVSAARERIKLEDRLYAAKEKSAKLDYDSATASLGPVAANRERVTRATENLASAQKRVNDLSSSSTITQQVSAYERLAEAKEGVAQATTRISDNLPTLRYALYDVSRMSAIGATAIAGLGTATLVTAAQFESAFTAVERTSGVTGDALEQLRGDFMQLSREMPLTFAELSNIGARGAQLGVASSELDNFTQTIAQFVATSDTVTMDQAVEAFGRLSNLLGDSDFNRIGSAITLVGVNAAATEGQIVKTTEELAPFAAAVGMSADEVIGLATAMGSLGQAPERARSAFLTLQRVMDTAVAEQGENLQVFGRIMGKTADEVSDLWKSDPSQFIASFSTALGRVDDLTTAFGELGIKERRAVQVFQALAADSTNAGDGVSVLNQALADSKQGYAEGTELGKQYGLIVDDLASKWKIFVNALQEFGNAVGSTLAPAAKVILDFVTGAIQGFTDMLNSPVGRFFIIVGASVAALVAGALGLVSVLALAGASLAATATVLRTVGTTGAATTGVVRTLTAAFREMGLAAGVTDAKMGMLTKGLKAAGWVGLALSVASLALSFMDLRASSEGVMDEFLGNSSGLAEALAQDKAEMERMKSEGVAGLNDAFIMLADSTGRTTEETGGLQEAMDTAASFLGVTQTATEDATGAIEDQSIALGNNAMDWIKNALIRSEQFQKIAANEDFANAWGEAGLNMEMVLAAAAEGGEQGVYDLYERMGLASEEGANFLANGWGHSFGVLGRILMAGVHSLQRAWEAVQSGNIFDVSFITTNFAALSAEIGAAWNSTVFNRPATDTARFYTDFVNQAKLAGEANVKAAQDAGEGNEDWADGLDKVGNAAEKAKEKLVSVSDYANELKGVFDRSFALRFDTKLGQDEITTSWRNIKKATEDAIQKIAEYRQKLRELSAKGQGLQSEKEIKTHWLSIAEAYGDSKRANALRADLAKLDADIAANQQDVTKTSKDLKKAQDSNSKTLKGNSDAAINNRKTLTDLVSKYQDQLVKLAESGASQEELAKKSGVLKAEFEKQAVALGFNRTEVKLLSDSFKDFKSVISTLPRNVSTSMEIKGLDPAKAALKEFAAKTAESMRNAKSAIDKTTGSANNLRGALGKKFPTSGPDTSPITRAGLAAEAAMLRKKLMDATFSKGAAKGNALAPYTESGLRSRLSALQGLGFAHGGYTGAGGKYQPAGIVHKGEYVIPKQDVNQATGRPYADALGRHQAGVRGYASGGYVTPAASSFNGQVSLTAGTIHAIAQAVRPHLYINNEQIAGAASSQFAHTTAVGAY